MENSRPNNQTDKKLADNISVGQNKFTLFLGDTALGMVLILLFRKLIRFLMDYPSLFL